MSAVYELIGRLVVQAIWVRYRRELQTAAVVGAGLAAIAAVAYVATRGEEDEG